MTRPAHPTGCAGIACNQGKTPEQCTCGYLRTVQNNSDDSDSNSAIPAHSLHRLPLHLAQSEAASSTGLKFFCALFIVLLLAMLAGYGSVKLS